MTGTSVPWADVIPPYRFDALHRLPNGDLLVMKAEWSGSHGNEYELYDRRGIRTAVLRLPSNERITGFGPSCVYVVTVDDDGIERLRKHPWP